MSVWNRLAPSDGQWERISPHIISDERMQGSSGRDNRMFVEIVLRIVRTGSPWLNLHEVFGEWEQCVPPLQPLERQGRLATHLHGDVG